MSYSSLTKVDSSFHRHSAGTTFGVNSIFRKGAMDKKSLERFRKSLQSQEDELERRLLTFQQQGRSVKLSEAKDQADQAAASEFKEITFAQNTQTQALLAGVKKALARIKDRTFGECLICGEDINLKRLEAVPWASHCLTCQEKIESGSELK
jgi:DnaK suppressor protein